VVRSSMKNSGKKQIGKEMKAVFDSTPGQRVKVKGICVEEEDGRLEIKPAKFKADYDFLTYWRYVPKCG